MSLVTFGFEDIEFIRPDDNGFDRIKTVIWRDRDFQAWVREVGTETALVEVTSCTPSSTVGGTTNRANRIRAGYDSAAVYARTFVGV